MLTKEQYIAAVADHEKLDVVPSSFAGVLAMVGGAKETFENGPAGGGYDDFGILWKCSNTGAGQAVPEPGRVVLDDVTKWREEVKFPDLDAYDWEEEAKEQLANVDRDRQAIEYGTWNAQFLRATHLMGFMDGLCAFVEEPEACRDLMDAITDYKIKLVERVAHYFKPDFVTSYDDVATERSLFVSPEVYRDLIKPQHKRLNDAIKAYGMYPIMHTCGKCEEIIGDFIDEGAVAWTSAQPVNDIEGILQQYGGQISVIGGYDTNGPAGREDASPDMIYNEVKRCLNTYGKYPGYIFWGFRMMNLDKGGADDPLGIGPLAKAYLELTGQL